MGTSRRVALHRMANLLCSQLRLEGTHSLTSRGAKTEGRTSGRVKPARPPLAQGVVPQKPGEHPRILFRSSGPPVLKQKLDTPLGQALFKGGFA